MPTTDGALELFSLPIVLFAAFFRVMYLALIGAFSLFRVDADVMPGRCNHVRFCHSFTRSLFFSFLFATKHSLTFFLYCQPASQHSMPDTLRFTGR
jgi:hypothetical protein